MCYRVIFSVLQFIERSDDGAIMQGHTVKLSRNIMSMIGRHIAWMDHCLKVSMGTSTSTISFGSLLQHVRRTYINPHTKSSNIPNQVSKQNSQSIQFGAQISSRVDITVVIVLIL
jgi:hypothetical protein